MEQTQLDWIGEFAGLALDREAYEQREREKDAAMQLMHDRMDKGMRDRLSVAFRELDVTVGGKKLGDMINLGGDQLKEIDRTELDGEIDDVTWDKVTAFFRALDEVRKNADYLANHTTEGRGPDGEEERVPLFTEKELTEEFYFPLVRERLIPDSIVPDPFSKTQKMIDATDALYDERIAQAKKEGGLTPDWDPMRSILEKGGKLASAAGDIAGSCGGADAKLAKDVLGLVALTADGLVAAKDLGDLKKDAIDSAGTITEKVGKIISKCIALGGQKEASEAFQSGWNIGKATGTMIARLGESPPNWEKAVVAFGDGLGEAISAANRDGDPVVRKIGVALSTAIKSGPTVKKVGGYLRDGKTSEAIDELLGLAETATTTATSEKFADDPSLSDADKAKATKDAEAKAKIIKKTIADLKKAAIETHQAMEADKALQQIQAASAEEFAQNTSSIEVLIKKMQRDRMIIELAAKIAQGGTAVMAKFVPGLGAVNAAVNMAANIMAAAQRAVDLNRWLKNRDDFRQAVSSLSAPAQNFVNNQKEQFSHYTIQAACDLAQFIGESLKLGGITAGAGAIVSASAGAAKTTEEVLYDLNREMKLEAAWKRTVKARENPRNRRLALQARSMNGTLAKYCVAWGAVIENDKMARTAMSACGLNETTLQHKDSKNADKVVKYLELYFKDDQTLVREFPATPEWAPGKVELTARFWVTVHAKGAKEGDLAKSSTGSVASLLEDVRAAHKDVEANQGETTLDAVVDDEVALLDELERALESTSPKHASSGEPHIAMQAVIDELLLLLTQERVWAEKQYNYADVGADDLFREAERTAAEEAELEALEAKLASDRTSREERERLAEEKRRKEEEKALKGARKSLDQALLRAKGSLKKSLKNVPFVYYEKVALKDGSFETGPLLCVNESSALFETSPYFEVTGAPLHGTIVAKGTQRRKPYLRFKGISADQMYNGLAKSGAPMKGFNGPGDLDLVT